jgi:DNA-binding LacI/PurR family transcriptional regulator
VTTQGKRPPTMVDVARAAGVAHITVSRVVNNEPTVRAATRDRVLRVIDELGYRRNDSARMLKSGRSTMLGVVLAGSELFELPRMLLGIEQAAKDAGHWVSLTSWQGGTHEQLEQCLGQLVGQGAAGVAVIADRPVALDALDRTVARVPISVVMSGNVANPAIGSEWQRCDEQHGGIPEGFRDEPPGQARAGSWRPTISAIHTGAYGGVQPGEAG